MENFRKVILKNRERIDMTVENKNKGNEVFESA